jgi:DNA-binding MarR family transcriptional regulator
MAPTLRLDQYLPYRLSVASNEVSRLIARAYQDRFGLTIAQWRLICVLSLEPSATPQTLVALTAMDKVMVSRAAQGLLARRLVQREPNASDGRSHHLVLSETGKALFQEVAPAALAYEAAVLEGLKPEEIALLDQLLRRIEAQARRLFDRPDLPQPTQR